MFACPLTRTKRQRAASRSALVVENGLVAVTEWEAEQGALTAEALAAADAVLERAGIKHAA